MYAASGSAYVNWFTQMVSKRVGAPYRSGPCSAWIKVKNPVAIEAPRVRSKNWKSMTGVLLLACTIKLYNYLSVVKR